MRTRFEYQGSHFSLCKGLIFRYFYQVYEKKIKGREESVQFTDEDGDAIRKLNSFDRAVIFEMTTAFLHSPNVIVLPK